MTASLSGVVYLDANANGTRDASDWGIADACVELTSASGDTILHTYTASDGSYSFANLLSGIYTVTLLTPSAAPGETSVGFLAKGDEVLPAVDSGEVAGPSTITNIMLADGFAGISYDFPQLVYPTELISKRLLLNTQPGIIHTTPTPEPSTLTLACLLGLMLCGVRRFRR